MKGRKWLVPKKQVVSVLRSVHGWEDIPKRVPIFEQISYEHFCELFSALLSLVDNSSKNDVRCNGIRTLGIMAAWLPLAPSLVASSDCKASSEIAMKIQSELWPKLCEKLSECMSTGTKLKPISCACFAAGQLLVSCTPHHTVQCS